MAIVLPTKKTKASFSMQNIKMMVYGVNRVGKTTFCSRAESPLFILTEPGGDYIEAYKYHVKSIGEYKELIKALQKGKHPYKSYVLDSIDGLAWLIEEDLCQALKVKTVAEIPFGKGNAAARAELERQVRSLVDLPGAVYATSHARLGYVDTELGSQTMWQYGFNEKSHSDIAKMFHVVGFANFEQGIDAEGKRLENRLLRLSASSLWLAGSREPGLPESMPFNFHLFKRAVDALGEKETLQSDTTYDVNHVASVANDMAEDAAFQQLPQR